jgi:radical SAM protein (TIGR01212 family)
LRYYAYSDFLKAKYGEKVYKIPIAIDADCPNRDGTKGFGGCHFCGAKGAGYETLSALLPVREQLAENIQYIGKKYNASKYIAYFQNYTNTYIPMAKLQEYCLAVCSFSEVVELCFSTRPDCITDKQIQLISEVTKHYQKNVCIELGLQTANYHTLAEINRGHGLAEFIDASIRIKRAEFELCAHVIPNLPGDTMADVVETARILSALKVDTVKIHALYIEKNTKLGEDYLKGEFNMIPMVEYVERVVALLEQLSPEIAIQRLAGRAPKDDTLFCNWGTSWWKIKDAIEEKLEAQDTFQGNRFNYLGGVDYDR